MRAELKNIPRNISIGVHALIVDEINKILITRRSKNDNYMPLMWDLPGGSVEMGEIVEDALTREVREETNICISPIKPIYVHTDLSQAPQNHIIQIVYKCAYTGGDIALRPDEHDEYRWIPYNDINKFHCIAFLENLSRRYVFEMDT